MNKPFQRICLLFVLITACCIHLEAQNFKTFNQNSSRSNNTLSLAFTPVFSTSVNGTNDSLLFRGNGTGFRFGGDYFFGKAGISFSSGFNSSSPDDAAINNFLKRSSVPPDQLTITKAKQQNMYLLIGPSVSFGNKVSIYAHAKGGLFINNSGLVNIQQKGAIRAAYRNESTDKSIYPGFLTGLSIQYKTKSDIWSFGIGTDYMNTKSEVNNYDARRGGGIEGLKLSRNITDIVTGITIRYNIGTARESSSGMATGRVLPTVNKREIISPRDAQSGLATGRVLPTVNKREIISSRDAQTGLATRRLLPTVNKKEIAIDESGVHRSIQESCGAVTKKISFGDGSTEEMTFACPDDAAAYEEKIKSTKQKNWLPSNFRTVSNESRDKGIISGRLLWPASNNGIGIVTNKTIDRGGSVSLNSQTSSTRTTPNNSFGTMVRMSAREAGSGMATGKRSRDASTGLATGKLYEPVFNEAETDVCNACIVTIKSNPLYNGNSGVQNNPLYQGKTTGVDADCDGIAGVNVLLLDAVSGTVVAKTKTENCGDFFFANVPAGDYIVKLNGVFAAKKGYDMYMKSKTDLLGRIQQGDDAALLMINTGTNEMQQKAGISTSRSNIRTKSISIIEADLDGDGEFESLKAIGIFSDGSTRDITNDARIAADKKNILIDGNALQMRRRVEVLKSNKQGDPNANLSITSIAVTNAVIKTKTKSNQSNDRVATGDVNGDGYNEISLKAIATFSDGSTQDVSDALAINTSHSNIKQYSVVVADLDGDGAADAVIKTKTKSNQSNDRVATGDVNGDGVNEVINTSHSNLKLLRVAVGDVNGDGVAESVVGGLIPGGPIISASKMPGEPIPGIDVKLGRNPGGQNLGIVTTNNDGEFEFTNIDIGDYFITMEQNVIIDDETFVTVGDNYAARNINTSEDNLGAGKTVVRGWNPTTKENTKNINSSETNLKDAALKNKEVKVSASQNSQTLRSILIEADLDGDGEFETDITNQFSDEITIDESGQITAPQMKAGVSTSRSNIRSRSGLQTKGDGLYVSYGKATLNNKEVNVKSILKTRHDTVKNSIGNIR